MYYIIVNPTSKSGLGKKIWNNLQSILDDKEISYKVVFTKGPGHAMLCAKNLLADEEAASSDTKIKLIVLGGDGTINEVLQGISDFDRVSIGYIPTGSSNDLARALKLKKDPEFLLDTILSEKSVRKLDLGELKYISKSDEHSRLKAAEDSNTRKFIVSCGIGFDAAVCEESLDNTAKRILNRLHIGKLTYLSIALKQLFASKKIACDLYIDNSDKPIHYNKVLLLATMIQPYEGGGFKFCPGADPSDGILDLCVVGDVSKAKVLIALPTAFIGKHYMFKGIERYSAKNIRIKTSSPLWVHTDGEVYYKADEIELTCSKQAVTFLV